MSTFKVIDAGGFAQLELLAHLVGVQLLHQETDHEVRVLLHELVTLVPHRLRHPLTHAVHHLLYFVLRSASY